MLSISLIALYASALGNPHTAGVGCRASRQKLSDDQFPILLENLEKIGDEKPLVFMIIIPSHPILEQSKIINIAMARTMYSPTLGKIVSIEGTYNGYQYPDNIGVDEVILKYSNLSKDFLIGKTFDEDKIDKLLQGNPTLITYVDTKINLNNKEFNYGNLFDSHFPQYKGLKILNYCTDYNWFLDTETDLGNHKIAVPPVEEQKCIADYLDVKTAAVDEQIQLQEQQIKLIDELKQSIISQAVTGKIKVF